MLDNVGFREPWWRGAVIYQIYPRSFCDTNDDGIGDLPGVIARLPYVASLGVDAIWLCPVFTSPQRDFGYDVSDHHAIDPIFGTIEDFDRLVIEAHALGLRVLVDQVWAHTSDRHAWFQASRRTQEGDRADWYVWADPAADGSPPNNWLSVFGGSAWTWEPRRRQYYLHHFLAHQPMLNLRSEAVVQQLLDTARFWLDRGVDGFRLDAIDFLLHDPQLRSNPAIPHDGTVPAKLFGLQNHAYDMLHPDALPVLERLRALTDWYAGACLLGEVSSQPGAFDRVQAYTSGADRLHMAYTLRPLREGLSWPRLRNLLTEAAGMQDGWPCWSFSNHDVERAATRWAVDGRHDAGFARMLLALLLSLRGSVIMYQGEELGLPEAELAEHELRDPFGITYWPEFRGRDGSRTPMPWHSEAVHAGFTGAVPWLPVPPAHAAMAVDAQADDPQSVLSFSRRLLAWRRHEPALRQGDMQVLDLPEPLIGFERIRDHSRVLALFNLSDTPVVGSLGDYVSVCPLVESGCNGRIVGEDVHLPGFGFLFASVIPAQEWQEQAAVAFA
jgi:alpha-glucosidase